MTIKDYTKEEYAIAEATWIKTRNEYSGPAMNKAYEAKKASRKAVENYRKAKEEKI